MGMKSHRRPLRLRGYDYASPGAYFVTVCTRKRECVFGEVADGVMVANDAGRVVAEEWHRTFAVRNNSAMDEYVVMPNHFHGIVVLHDRRGTARRAPTMEGFGAPIAGSIPTIVRAFKSAVTKRINGLCGTPGASVWQRGYYEHIIRNENEWCRIRRYIAENPACWGDDTENPQRPGRGNS